MAEPIFVAPFFLEYILPFVLIFTLVFAILQKTELLGEGKKQNDAIVGLVIGLILVAFPFARSVVVNLMPFLAISIAILLVFMIIYGFVYGNVSMHKWVKIVIMVIFGAGLLSVLLVITNVWDYLYDFLFSSGGTGSTILINALLIILMAGAIIAVLKGKSSGPSESE
jgi:hypothetical protein